MWAGGIVGLKSILNAKSRAEALTVLKRKTGDGQRLYDLIYLTYITPESLTHPELLYRLNTYPVNNAPEDLASCWSG